VWRILGLGALDAKGAHWPGHGLISPTFLKVPVHTRRMKISKYVIILLLVLTGMLQLHIRSRALCAPRSPSLLLSRPRCIVNVPARRSNASQAKSTAESTATETQRYRSKYDTKWSKVGLHVSPLSSCLSVFFSRHQQPAPFSCESGSCGFYRGPCHPPLRDCRCGGAPSLFVYSPFFSRLIFITPRF
jgi:hypothetical protein